MKLNRLVNCGAVLICAIVTVSASAADSAKSDSGAALGKLGAEWNQWGGSSVRNNTPEGHDIPAEWNIGEIDYRTGAWNSKNAKNVKWVARLGSQTYGNTVVSGGHAYIGSNNSGGWLKRYPPEQDLGVLLCFDIKDGKFLWQAVHDKQIAALGMVPA